MRTTSFGRTVCPCMPLFLAVAMLPTTSIADDSVLRIEQTKSAVTIRLGDVELVQYALADDVVRRPHFACLRTPSGIQVTRNHPPRDGEDAVDHSGMHTGVWLSFGDLNGHDAWRLKVPVETSGFAEPAAVTAGVASFAVSNVYRDAPQGRVFCKETCHIAVELVQHGYLLRLTSRFEPAEEPLRFGDQEEMGLGLRVATPLAVTSAKGGRIRDASGRLNGENVWGTSAEWCDYSGPIDGRWAGVAVMSSPANFRPSWHHARDYGLLVANPFGRKALTGGEPSVVAVGVGESLELGFGILVHESPGEADCDVAGAFRHYAGE